MATYILFSKPEESVLEKIATELFYKPNMTVAYIPSDGSNSRNPVYAQLWKDYIEEHKATFVMVDNSLRGEDVRNEAEKITNADAHILTGGNTFQFLHHLRESGLDKVITDFAKEDKVIAGFSAGAIILSPTIAIAKFVDENTPELKDLTGLNLIEFDVFAHYEPNNDKKAADEFERKSGRKLLRIQDEEFRIVES